MMNSPRWTDPDLTLQANVGEINGEALGRAEAVLEGLLQVSFTPNRDVVCCLQLTPLGSIGFPSVDSPRTGPESTSPLFICWLQDRVHRAKWFGAHVTEPVGGPDPTPLNPEMDWREFVQTVSSTPGSLQGQYRAGGRAHTPSRVAPPVGRNQLPQGSSAYSPIELVVGL